MGFCSQFVQMLLSFCTLIVKWAKPFDQDDPLQAFGGTALPVSKVKDLQGSRSCATTFCIYSCLDWKNKKWKSLLLPIKDILFEWLQL